METEPLDLESGPVVALGSVWSEDGCRLRLRRPGRPSTLVEAVGLELTYRVEAKATRHCLGHHSPKRNEGRYLDCDNPPREGSSTCVRCAVADAEFAADLHHAHTRRSEDIHESVLHHLKRPNVLYLAAFRDGSIKIGTSTGTRRHTRLAEQGAWRAVEAAEVADGFAVRRLEDLITENLGLPQAVATSRKLRAMTTPRDDAELDRALTERLAEVHELLASEAGLAAGPATPSETWWHFPGADAVWWDRPHQYPSPLETGSHRVRIEAMCGRVAALSRPGGSRPDGHDDRFVADLGRLWGRELELGAFEPDELLVQDTLF